jgi:ubiquinone/menaquinone biosynthesis C-methylase UbiE
VKAWLEIRGPLERQLEPLGRAAMEALDLRAGQRVLDVGCGIGRTPLALARAIGPAGHVTGMDLLEDAVRVAEADAELPANLSFLCGDAQHFPFAPRAFDSIFSRFGVMFFGDPIAAFRNLRAALKPGGKLGFVCWRRLEENELDRLPLEAAASRLPAELVKAIASAEWFSFADPDHIRRLLENAGFEAIQIQPHDDFVKSGSLGAMIDVCSRVGALGAALRARPDLRDKAIEALRRELVARDGPGGPALQAGVWLVSARSPG